MQDLYDKLKDYSQSQAYPFHMPGHKRRMGVPKQASAVDITEIDGFDNLHHAEGILKEAQERAAKLYKAQETWFLINGSTAGILAAISACVRPGGRLLMARGSHKAAYHAAQIRALKTSYLYPRTLCTVNGSIFPEDVERALEEDDRIEAVFITSPTYEGVISDIAGIAAAAHAHHIPLIVDEAHGAHLGFHPYFPETSLHLGADIVIHSLHKTLPSMTQTALLHKNGTFADSRRLQKFLDIYQSSSPSYVLMASIDACIGLLSSQADALFDAFAERLRKFSKETQRFRHIHFIRNDSAYAQDPSKLVFTADGLSGRELGARLREQFALEMEMEAGAYVVALTSVADTQEGFDRLLSALDRIDAELEDADDRPQVQTERLFKNRQVMTIAEADAQAGERVPLGTCEGRISAEYLYLYPPGIPMIVPGERIGHELAKQIRAARAAGLSLQGLSDYSMETIEVLREHSEDII